MPSRAVTQATNTDAEAGTTGNPVKLSDPRAMRALAHPARLAIMEHLALEGPATATECAAVAGLSPSACSYHLRTLARYGFVAEDRANAADARHRPWRALAVSFDVASVADYPRAAAPAARLLLEASRARNEQIRSDYQQREAAFPRQWRAAAGWMEDVLHVSPAELDQFRLEVMRLAGRYRRLNTADRPSDAQRVLVVLDLIPWFNPDDTAERQ